MALNIKTEPQCLIARKLGIVHGGGSAVDSVRGTGSQTGSVRHGPRDRRGAGGGSVRDARSKNAPARAANRPVGLLTPCVAKLRLGTAN